MHHIMLIIQYTSKQLNTSADKMAGFIRGSSLGFNQGGILTPALFNSLEINVAFFLIFQLNKD